MKKRRNIQYILTAIITMLLLSTTGCIFDIPENDEQGEGIILLSLKNGEMQTRGGDLFSGDALVTKARVIVFAGSVVEYNHLYMSGDADFNNPIRITVATGTKMVYVIANETSAAMTSALEAVNSIAALEALMADNITAGLTSPIVMMGKKQVDLNTPGLKQESVTLIRAAAKINIKLKKDCIEEVIISKISLLSNTGKTPLWEGGATVSGQTYWNYSNTLTTPQTLTTSDWDALTLYVYENLGNSETNKTKATQLELEGTFDGVFATYRVYINEDVSGGTDGDPSSSTVDTPPAAHYYNIKRNHEYQLTGTIKRIGEHSVLYIKAKILPWTVHNGQLEIK